MTNNVHTTGLNDIAVFVCVVQTGSFTAAAERLNLSKSVVSKYVTRLEDRLGARLLVRTTRRLNLTEVGRVFYERSRQGLEAIENAEQEVSVLQGEPRGTLRVNSPMSFGVLHVAPAIADFMDRFPDVSVDMSFDDRRVDIIGVVSVKDYSAQDGEMLVLGEFDSLEAVDAWKTHPEHLNAQPRGQENFFADYQIQVCSVVRTTEWAKTGQ